MGHESALSVDHPITNDVPIVVKLLFIGAVKKRAFDPHVAASKAFDRHHRHWFRPCRQHTKHGVPIHTACPSVQHFC